MKNILVIKHGALGDLIQSTGILKSIREHNHSHKITLLTDPKFFFFTKELPYFDDIIYTDELHSLGTFLIAKRNDKPYQQNSK